MRPHVPAALRRPTLVGAVLSLAILASACFLVRKGEIREIPPDAAPGQEVRSPVRVFLPDGSVVVFPEGLTFRNDTLVGRGHRHDLEREPAGAVGLLALDSVIGMEAFDGYTDPGLSLLVSVGVTVVGIGGMVALACAADPKCFGSCPTIYSADPDGEILEAEAFSYSISPLLEGRDLDLLVADADPSGRLELEIRNEALETHFINHLALVEVRHRPGEDVVPDASGQATIVGRRETLEPVRDRSGRDVAQVLARADERVYATPSARLATVSPEDFLDWIEIDLPSVDRDTVALALRLRNSLLNTVLFYDFMLGAQGARALDWLGRDIRRIGTAVELGRWYRRTMGLRVEVETAAGFEEVGRVPDTGPIAWDEVVVRVPVRRGRPTLVRLSFLADAWRIDRVSLAREVRPAQHRTLPVAALLRPGGSDDPALRDRVAQPDETYLVTSAGSYFTVRFEAGPVESGVDRTFLLSSQGYYTEWVRPGWVRSAAGEAEPFRPSDELLTDLMARWREVKGPMEERFHATRIPVR